jgi:hypothetical protein
MKEFTITPKGFKVLPVTNNEIFGWGGLGVCDTCNNPVHNEGTFVAVLNSVYCKKCYEDWHKMAINYPEDKPYEERYAARMLERLGNNG